MIGFLPILSFIHKKMHDRVDSTRVTGGRVCWLSIDISPDSLCVRLLASCPTTIFIIERGDDLFSSFFFFSILSTREKLK